MNFSRWSPELRRALTAVRPEFFGWTAEQRLRYRVALPDEDRAAIIRFLLAASEGTDGE